MTSKRYPRLSPKQWVELSEMLGRASKEYPALEAFKVGALLAVTLSGVHELRTKVSTVKAAMVMVLLLCASTVLATPGTGSNCTGKISVTSNAGSSNANLASTPAVGSWIVLTVGSFRDAGATSATAGAMTDNQSGNTYTSLVSLRATTSNTGNKVEISGGKVVAASGTFNITFTFGASQTVKSEWQACEVTGVLASALDQVGTKSTCAVACNGTSLTAIAAGANSQASAIDFAVIFDLAGTNTASGYTQLFADTTHLGIWAGYKIESSVVTSQAGWTFSANNEIIGVIVTLDASGGGGVSTRHDLGLMGVGQ